MDLAFREFIGDNVCAIDLTPMPGIDDLLQPTESIKEAQELAAEAWGADHSFFLINGSTSGNQCMMMAAVNPGEKIAVPRNSHKSMLGGLIMSGAEPIYMQPEVDEELRMDHCVTPETVSRDACTASGPRRGLPGLADVLRRRRRSRSDRADRSRRRQIAAGRRGVGTALSLSPAICRSRQRPREPISASTRRTRCSRPSRSARCCIRKARVSASTGLTAVLKMFLSTSPNLPMVASLDVARKQMATEGEALLTRTIAARARDAHADQSHSGTLLLRRRASWSKRRIRARSNENRGDRDRARLYGLRSFGDTAAAAQHPSRVGGSVQRRCAGHDRHDAGCGRPFGHGVERDGARRSQARHVCAVGNTRAAFAARELSLARDSADADASARRLSCAARSS